jgi:hypothetical protein
VISWILYALFAHQLIEAMYEGKSIGILNRIIEGQTYYPIEYYFEKADRLYFMFFYYILAIILTIILTPKMSRIYSIISNRTEFYLQWKGILLLSITFASVALLVCVAIFILQNFPNSGDEYIYIYQAKNFLAGRFWNKPHPLQEFFDFANIINKDGKLFGQFFPGWPLVLTCAIFLKIPLYFVNPILGTLSLLAVFFLGKKLYNEKVAVLSMIFTMFSSFFLFNSASYWSHTLCSLLLVLFVYHSLCFVDSEKVYNAVLSGLFFGAAFITQTYTAILCGIPVFVYSLFKPIKHFQKTIWFFVGSGPFFLFFLFYNYKLTGNAFIFPYMLNKYNSFSMFSLKQIEWSIGYLKEFIIWTPPFILIIYFIYLRQCFKNPQKNLIGLFFPILVLGYFFYKCYVWNHYGPRYYYSGFPFLILFVVSALFKEKFYIQKNFFGKLLFSLFIFSLLLNIPQLVDHLIEERKVIWERRDLYRLSEKEKIKNAIIFIKTGTGAIRPMIELDLTRNDADYTNNVLYALDLGENNHKLMEYYPERDYYIYYYHNKERHGYLQKSPLIPNIESGNKK